MNVLDILRKIMADSGWTVADREFMEEVAIDWANLQVRQLVGEKVDPELVQVIAAVKSIQAAAAATGAMVFNEWIATVGIAATKILLGALA